MFGSKAQITIFVIIGLVLFLGAGAYFYMSNSQVEKSLDSQFELSDDADIAMIQSIYLSCSKSVLEDNINNLTLSSFLTPSSSPSLNGNFYFYFSGKSFYPERVVVERRFSDFIKSSIFDCVDSSLDESILSSELIGSTSDFTVETSIGDNSISLVVDPVLSLKSDSSTLVVDPVVVSKKSRVGLTYSIGRSVLFPPVNSSVFYGPAEDLATDNNFYFSIFPSKDAPGDLLVTIQDFSSNPLEPNYLKYLIHYASY